MSFRDHPVRYPDAQSSGLFRGYCTRVKDGDTIAVDLDLGFGVAFSVSIRLQDFSAPEIRGTQGAEKAEADRLHKELADLVLDKPILVRTEKTRKGDPRRTFTRYVADVYLPGRGPESDGFVRLVLNVAEAMTRIANNPRSADE